MGQFGYASYSCDNCWDLLGRTSADIYEMTQAEADNTLSSLWLEEPEYGWSMNGEGFDKLGVVCWILKQGLRVTKPILADTMKFAQAELSDEALGNGWKTSEGRKQAVDKEVLLIAEALAGDGTVTPKPIKTLVEQEDKKGCCPFCGHNVIEAQYCERGTVTMTDGEADPLSVEQKEFETWGMYKCKKPSCNHEWE